MQGGDLEDRKALRSFKRTLLRGLRSPSSRPVLDFAYYCDFTRFRRQGSGSKGVFWRALD